MAKERTKPSQFRIFDANMIASTDTVELGLEQTADLQNLYDQNQATFKVGGIVNGTILEKKDDHIIVDINYKSNGSVPAYEFNALEFQELKIGAPVEVLIEELENADGAVTLSYEKAKASRAWEKISQLYHENKPISGMVVSKVKGGLYVDIGITAFLPGSQIDIQRVSDFDRWIGQKINAYIIKLIPKRGNVIISRRKYIHEQKSEQRKGIFDNLTEGQVIVGTVKNVTKYGAFVDIGGVDGLLHITDMTWRRIEDPTEILKIGDDVTVKILSFDRTNEKISLGMKQLTENPWEQLAETVEVGSTIKGHVISIKDYGIFVEVVKGVEGLVHISEISWTDRITDLNKHFKIGQEVEASVVSLERKNRRMSLSIKQLEKSPWDNVFESYTVGQKISGKVTNIADFGFFIQIAPGVDGLVHVSDISWTQHIKHPADVYKKDDMVEAVITEINKQKRKISLSIKGLTKNPWETVTEKLPVGSSVRGTVIKIADFGAFIRLEDTGIEAFIHSSECSDDSKTSMEEALKIGESYVFRVIRISAEEQKIGLSLKKQHSEDSAGSHKRAARQNNNNNGEKREKFNRNEKQQSSATSSSTTQKKSSLQLELEKLMQQNNK